MKRITPYLRSPWVVMPAVAAIAVAGWFAFGRSDESGATATPTERVVEATVGTMARTVSAEGTVSAAETEDLSFASSGTVTSVHVAAGDTVEAGQVLAEMDSAVLDAEVAAAEVTLAEAQAKLADDESAGATDAQLAANESSVSSALDQLASAMEAARGAQLVASIDGTVASISLTEGESLGTGGSSATSSTGSGSGSGESAGTLGGGDAQLPGAADATGETSTDAQVSLISSGRYLAELSFDDIDVASVEVGQLATVSLSTSTTSTFGGFGGGPATANESNTDDAPEPAPTTDGPQGYVAEVGSVADASSGVASYPVTVAFADDSGTFNVGATVAVDITYDEVADAVQVPVLAVTTVDGEATVEVRSADGTETRVVTTGLSSDSMVQITDGLEGGESVVVALPTAARGDAESDSSANEGFRGGGTGPREGFTPPAGFTPPGQGGG